ncbi:DTW domain-containing protein [Aestuariicella hydrocarbonica]|uniref:tRNA-uridine aminocarboxypropyltransferase n=1 Tax=Pseudomaricurvus hydrocarbonicus TaxID=1470433 RepID=A0A9E5MLK0_9GAMM|nr:DTW domain-containing protein [Aestuariicella hydrocarbonica]
MTECGRCHWRKEWCLCEQAPQLTPRLHVLLLTHEREHAKLSNTGRLLEASLPNAHVLDWQRKTAGSQVLEIAGQQGLTPILLFPEDRPCSERAVMDLPLSFCLSSSVPHDMNQLMFIVLDGTWQQAAKMVRSSPELQRLPRLELQSDSASAYQLRKNQQPGHFSTVETGLLLMQTLGFNEDAERLHDYFQCFLQHYEAQRSNHRR